MNQMQKILETLQDVISSWQENSDLIMHLYILIMGISISMGLVVFFLIKDNSAETNTPLEEVEKVYAEHQLLHKKSLKHEDLDLSEFDFETYKNTNHNRIVGCLEIFEDYPEIDAEPSGADKLNNFQKLQETYKSRHINKAECISSPKQIKLKRCNSLTSLKNIAETKPAGELATNHTTCDTKNSPINKKRVRFNF